MSTKRMMVLGLAAGAGALLLRLLARRDSLAGKVVVITGGSRGLGLELARRCLEKNAKVALLARDEAALKRAAEQLDGRVLTFACDVADQPAVRHAIDQVNRRYGEVDVLMHVARQMVVGPLKTMELSDYERQLNTHLYGAIHAVNAVLPQMRERERGHLVFISSIGGKIAIPHLLPYSASKFALTGYAEALRAELSNNGIGVTTVFPGLMRTGSPRNADFKGQHQREYAWFALGDSLPLVSMSSRAAAKKIVDGCERRRAEVLLLPFGKELLALRALMPELFASVLALANALLPRPGDGDGVAHKGHQSESKWTRSVLMALTRRAEVRNNQRAPEA
ncbi:MAG: SDR family NAD(P)-dependent oxidoreductase [Myxococcaceae bacterium]